ncbi:MAG TPA: DUF362 domain-containing protein [Planctomycetota bacterium]|jgi:hypothetical protein|nr:DUF362 domain-containing protein [Planctomycetota bacterium]
MTTRAKVAVLRTRPETVLEDYGRLIRLAEIARHLPKDRRTCLKINVSWQLWYPGCSTTPWQLDGVLKAMLEEGYRKDLLYGCHNRTVVVDGEVGEVLNKQRAVVVDKYGLENVHVQPKKLRDFRRAIERGEWVRHESKANLAVLRKTFPQGQFIPKRFYGENILHFPTLKTHVHTTMTGAMKNAFGALLHHERHWAHGCIHETLVDLLAEQKEIFSGIFAVMDGTLAGSGAGPRTMVPHECDVILASGDQVAIDAIASRLMGFDPMSIRFIRLAHERGLGVGDPREIEVVGDDVSKVNFGFTDGDNFASRGQKAIYGGFLKPVENLLMKTWLVPWSYLASRAYHDWFWYNVHGRKWVKWGLQTKWGRLFQSYPYRGAPSTPMPRLPSGAEVSPRR